MAEPSPQMFAERMRREREKRQWSQHELARQAGVDYAWINRLEKGERFGISLWTAVRVALVLGGDLNYLTGLTDELMPSEVWLAGVDRLDAAYPR